MFTITLVLNNSATNFGFSYKEEAIATAAMQNIHDKRKEHMETGIDSLVVIKDEFGHKSEILASVISGVLMANVEEENNYSIEKNVLAQRAQKRLQDRLANDPVIRLSSSNLSQA